MADTGLVNLFQTQFSTRLEMLLQQKMSRLRGRVEEGSHTGSKLASPIQFLGPMSLATPAGRFAPISNNAADYTRRWVTPQDKDGAQLVDNFDQLKTPIDPKSQLVARAAAACARQWDDEIIRSATATAVTGVDGTSTEAWDTAWQVSGTFDSATKNGLTVGKLNEARRLLEKAHVFEDGESATLIIGSQQHADLRNQALVTSSDFNSNGGVLVNGVVTRFMGFDLVVSERLPVITDKDSNTNQRGCLAFVKSGLYLGMWKDVTTDVRQRADLTSLPWQIYTQISFGATRTQLGKIIQVCATDTTGADNVA